VIGALSRSNAHSTIRSRIPNAKESLLAALQIFFLSLGLPWSFLLVFNKESLRFVSKCIVD
jgi:hypothetical protein